MNILIVDDDNYKVQKIRAVIESFESDVSINVASCNSEAVNILRSVEKIELLILDLFLPVRLNESPKKDGGIMLLKEIIRNPKLTNPTHVLGLTSYEDVKEVNTPLFENESWHIATFDAKKTDWEEKIRNKLNYIRKPNSSWSFSWSVKSFGIAVLGGVAIFIVTGFFKIAVIGFILLLVFLILRNPRRRYYRAGWGVLLTYALTLVPSLRFTSAEGHSSFEFNPGGEMWVPTVLFVILSGFLFYLDYRVKS